jgi:hypothetical protein
MFLVGLNWCPSIKSSDHNVFDYTPTCSDYLARKIFCFLSCAYIDNVIPSKKKRKKKKEVKIKLQDKELDGFKIKFYM